jgi:hypothetical protein
MNRFEARRGVSGRSKQRLVIAPIDLKSFSRPTK